MFHTDPPIKAVSIPVLIMACSLAAPLARGQVLQPRLGEPLDGLSADELQRFDDGKVQFDRIFQVEEGLGPIMNQNSCASCHSNPVGGSGTITVTRFGFADPKSGEFNPLAEFGGTLLQAQAITNPPGCGESVPPQANRTATRATPSMLGFGLLDALTDADLQFAADNPPPGISGRYRVNAPLEGGPPRVARFGWKGGVPTVMTFSGDASLNEMGITNDLVPEENAPNGDDALLEFCDTVEDPEDDAPQGQRFIDKVTDFQRFLAQPPQTPKSGMTGESIFEAIGCTDCHIRTFVTPNDPSLEPALRNKVIHPYTDLLLHSMGQLFDGIVDGVIDDPMNPEDCVNCALADEIRTPPLWGLRIRDPMLHDASVAGGPFAERVTTAITQHGLFGSEAKPSVDDFLALSPDERDHVIAFLDSLGREEYDHNGDRQVDGQDFAVFLGCFNAPVQDYIPDDACAISDLDQDGDVDCDDYDGFRLAWTASGLPPTIEECAGGPIDPPTIVPVPAVTPTGMLLMMTMLGIGLGWARRRTAA